MEEGLGGRSHEEGIMFLILALKFFVLTIIAFAAGMLTDGLGWERTSQVWAVVTVVCGGLTAVCCILAFIVWIATSLRI